MRGALGITIQRSVLSLHGSAEPTDIIDDT